MFKPGALRSGLLVLGCAALIVVLGGCPGAPTVSSTAPSNGATGVAINTQVTATFSRTMDPETITTTTFTLTRGATAVAGTVALDGATAVFTPTAALLPNTVYTARITTGAQALKGVTLKDSTCADRGPRRSHPGFMVTPTTFPSSFSQGTPVVSSNDNEALWLIPVLAGLLTAGIAGYAISTSGEDALAEDYVWSFTTGSAPDLTPPTVIITHPEDGAIGVPVGANFTVTFSEAMAPLTIGATTFTLRQGATSVAGTVTYAGVTASFVPTVDLTANTLYTLTITTGATDLAGNALAANHVWTFTTGALAAQSDYFTANYLAGVPLDDESLTFTPDGSWDFYKATNDPALGFPTSPAGGTDITSLFAGTNLVEQNTTGISFYGIEYDHFFVGKTGLVSFGDAGSTASNATLTAHFATPQISALSTIDASAGGTVSVKTTSSLIAVTYADVPTAGGTANVQVELFFDGTIRMTYLDVIASSGIVGLSPGTGTPTDFTPSDLTAYNTSGAKTAP